MLREILIDFFWIFQQNSYKKKKGHVLKATYLIRQTAKRYTYSVSSFISNTDYGHTRAKSLCGPKSNLNRNRYMGCGYKGLVLLIEIMVEYWKTWTRDSLHLNGC